MNKSKRSKRLFTVVLSMILLLICTVSAVAKEANPFKDIKESDWYYKGVQYVYEHKLMVGMNENTFDPTGEVTRAMMVTILYNYEGQPKSSSYSKTPFSDVPSGKWYSTAVGWAADKKVVSGYTDGTFRPDEILSREQMATILYYYAEYKKFDTSKLADLSKFKDASSISKWAQKPMAWANENKVINGMSGTELAPKGNATRAQAAAVFMGYREKFGTGATPTPAPTATPTSAPTPTPTAIPVYGFNYTATEECVPEAWKNYAHGGDTENGFWIDVPSDLTEIPEKLFMGNTAITSVTIPESVESLGKSAFQECTNLTEVNFPENTKLTAISELAFNKTGLTSVTIPKEIETIGKFSFNGCASLANVQFEENSKLKEVGFGAFSTTGLTSVTIPASVTTLGQSAFYKASLNSITFAEGSKLETMGTQALCDTNITTITIPKSVKSLGYSLFNGCNSLETVTFESGTEIEAIGRMAFQNCAITAIEIPASVKSIDECAFLGCTALETVTFADGALIETIGLSAFQKCAITAIEIPNSVKSIGNNAFYECSSLATLTFDSDSSLETIGDKAFYKAGLSGFVNLRENVQSIGVEAFAGLSMPKDDYNSINVWASTPPTLGEKAFGEYDDGYWISGDNDAYKTAEVWKDYWRDGRGRLSILQ